MLCFGTSPAKCYVLFIRNNYVLIQSAHRISHSNILQKYVDHLCSLVLYFPHLFIFNFLHLFLFNGKCIKQDLESTVAEAVYLF